MFKKENLLTKKYLNDKYSTYDREKVYSKKEEFVKFLQEIEEEFYIHDFKRDDRYVCLGRHRFLIDEMEQLYYTNEQCQKLGLHMCPTVWCLDSLIEIMCRDNFLGHIDYQKLINISETYLNKSFEECRNVYNSYVESGIISLNERDYILHALNMIKDSLKKCDENMKWKEC